MNVREFTDLCRELIVQYVNEHLGKSDNKRITEDDVHIVWMCKTLQHSKALASTALLDGMCYEITYNGDKEEVYFDAYKKRENQCVKFV